jgi:protein phosphatase
MIPNPVILEAYGQTDPGKMREANEDQYFIARLHRSLVIEGTSASQQEGPNRRDGLFQATVLLVADGMGGEAAGDRASQIAIETIVDYLLNSMPWFYRLDTRHGGDLVTMLREGIALCNTNIQEFQRSEPDQGRMGTTLTMAYVLWPNLYVVHVGDSRCYLVRDGELRQLTKDHTVAQLMIDQGKDIALDDERYGHMLWNAVGADPSTPPKPQIGKYELAVDDQLMLCSDGLYGMISDEKIKQLLLAPCSAKESCRQLIDAALDHGGEDNVTTVVAQFHPQELDDEPSTIQASVPPSEDDEPTLLM